MHYGWPTVVLANVLVAAYRALQPSRRWLGWPSVGWEDGVQVESTVEAFDTEC